MFPKQKLVTKVNIFELFLTGLVCHLLQIFEKCDFFLFLRLQASLNDVTAKVDETATALVTLACAYDSQATLIRTIHILKIIESKNAETKNAESTITESKNTESQNVESTITESINTESQNVECLLDVRDVINALTTSDNQQSVIKIPEMENFAGLNILNGDRFACKSSHPRRLKSSTCDGHYLYVGNDSG